MVVRRGGALIRRRREKPVGKEKRRGEHHYRHPTCSEPIWGARFEEGGVPNVWEEVLGLIAAIVLRRGKTTSRL